METTRYEKRLKQQKASYESRKARLRELYKYARQKGFTPVEAQALSFESKEFIDNLKRKS